MPKQFDIINRISELHDTNTVYVEITKTCQTLQNGTIYTYIVIANLLGQFEYQL